LPTSQAFRAGRRESGLSRQQPGGDTPGVAAAPVALAGAIVPGVDRFIVVLSAHADVFGVGMTGMIGSMLVPPSCMTSCGIVPGGRFAGISGVESGKAAPLVGGPPGMELHTMVEALPGRVVGGIFPVVVVTIGDGMVPSGVAGVVAADDIVTADGIGMDGAAMEGEGRGGSVGGCGAGMVVPGKSVMNDVAGCADSVSIGATVLPVVEVEGLAGAADVGAAAVIEGIVPIAVPVTVMEVIGTAAVPGAICPVGVEQVTTVPGIVGSEASGTGANVVSDVPGCVAAENGLGPLSGDVTIAPGVDESPMAVVPMVETCARPALQPDTRMAVISNKFRMAIACSAPI
jgi:hypothetical protein